MIFRVEGYRLTAATGSGVPHFKNCPCPLRGAGSPSRTTTTPREIVMKLHGELLRMVKAPEVQKQLLNAGQEVAWQETPEQFGEMLKVEAAKWARMVKESGAQVN